MGGKKRNGKGRLEQNLANNPTLAVMKRELHSDVKSDNLHRVLEQQQQQGL
jgi:hypothetical protein